MDIPIHLKRLVTILSKELTLKKRRYDSGYEVQFNESQIYSILYNLVLSDSDKEILDNGGRLKIAYWIESHPNES